MHQEKPFFEKEKEIQSADLSEVRVEVVLDETKFSESWPEGKPGERKRGFSFFALRDNKSGFPSWDYLTSEMGEKPVLYAVGKDQFENWKSSEVKAIPADFVWDDVKKLWRVESPLN